MLFEVNEWGPLWLYFPFTPAFYPHFCLGIVGLGDASTPLVCGFAFNIINFVSDFFFIRQWSLGIVGAALASGLSHTLALVPLLLLLNKRVSISFFKFNISSFSQYLIMYGRAGIYLLGRSLARIAAFSYCSRRSVRVGSLVAFSICLFHW